ncbi:Na+/H+ antiporter subunit E [Aquamicrobium zhengzhouense]|uniref:Na+/H+ antiporter subunit E n=1 Tax=Aquamicrobium zhengzhouense TaxID=2781738 RepID=A0ABS0S8G7_9HYPH|nr:Na+/H+ antiporter subunit E [Aquamicrobium zhengzhouense]MBI1619516.1 Na+/H+ antiporter subunit E [Aquamicrobium zhengzhouense]
MKRLFPFPLLTVSLIGMWLLLTSFSLGNLILGTAVALLAVQGLVALDPVRPNIKRWDLLPKLLGIVLLDIIRSNIAVVTIILQGKKRARTSGFLSIPLDLRDPVGLAILSVIITSTPGTAWMDYDSAKGTVLLHIFDLVDEAEWMDIIKNRYEHLLREIFE